MDFRVKFHEVSWFTTSLWGWPAPTPFGSPLAIIMIRGWYDFLFGKYVVNQKLVEGIAKTLTMPRRNGTSQVKHITILYINFPLESMLSNQTCPFRFATSIPDRQQLNQLLIMMETFLPLQRIKTKAAQIVAVCIRSSTHQWCDTSSKHCPGNGTMAHSHTRPAPGILKILVWWCWSKETEDRWLAHIKTGNCDQSQGVSNVCCSI